MARFVVKSRGRPIGIISAGNKAGAKKKLNRAVITARSGKGRVKRKKKKTFASVAGMSKAKTRTAKIAFFKQELRKAERSK